MLSAEKNELLTRVGRGTSMGELLRRFWLPAMLEDELGTPDGSPVRLRLLGEDLVAFRDTNGDIGILDAHCPHRRAQLYFGRNEECGLRCAYHGWKFDVRGNCVERPAEPFDSQGTNRVRVISYPAQTRGGVVWVYMGPPDFPSEPPNFEWTRAPAGQRIAYKRHSRCNWAQGVDGVVDSSHISFLHRNLADLRDSAGEAKSIHARYARVGNPTFFIAENDAGFLAAARREAEADTYFWRVTPFMVPFYTITPPILLDTPDSRGLALSWNAYVPIDDESTWVWRIACNPLRTFTDKERDALLGPAGRVWGPVDETFRPLRNKDNDYLIDRDMQRNVNFTGIVGVPDQDAAVTESMGVIVDRSKEHLGASDRAVVAFRRRLLRMAQNLQEGHDPDAARMGELYNVRAASFLADRAVHFEERIGELMAVPT